LVGKEIMNVMKCVITLNVTSMEVIAHNLMIVIIMILNVMMEINAKELDVPLIGGEIMNVIKHVTTGNVIGTMVTVQLKKMPLILHTTKKIKIMELINRVKKLVAPMAGKETMSVINYVITGIAISMMVIVHNLKIVNIMLRMVIMEMIVLVLDVD
jgi:hypothetical protein